VADRDLAADPGAEEESADAEDERGQEVEADHPLPEWPVLLLEGC